MMLKHNICYSQSLQVPKERWSHEMKKRESTLKKLKAQSTILYKYHGIPRGIYSSTEHEGSLMKLGFRNFSQSHTFLAPKVTVHTSCPPGPIKRSKRFDVSCDLETAQRKLGEAELLDIPIYFVTIF